MRRRKIADTLLSWKTDSNRKPVVLKGCGQCGKVFVAQPIGREGSVLTLPLYMAFLLVERQVAMLLVGKWWKRAMPDDAGTGEGKVVGARVERKGHRRRTL